MVVCGREVVEVCLGMLVCRQVVVVACKNTVVQGGKVVEVWKDVVMQGREVSAITDQCNNILVPPNFLFPGGDLVNSALCTSFCEFVFY